MAWLLALWVLVLLAGAWLWWLWEPEPETPARPAPDPYAAEVARFRRQVHDWDRG